MIVNEIRSDSASSDHSARYVHASPAQPDGVDHEPRLGESSISTQTIIPDKWLVVDYIIIVYTQLYFTIQMVARNIFKIIIINKQSQRNEAAQAPIKYVFITP